ncbi:MAG: hypothetical protein ACRD1K_13765 [Acidimicrobiales bacterium]
MQRFSAEHDGRTLDCVEVIAHEVIDGKIVRTYHRPDQHAIDTLFRIAPGAPPWVTGHATARR